MLPLPNCALPLKKEGTVFCRKVLIGKFFTDTRPIIEEPAGSRVREVTARVQGPE